MNNRIHSTRHVVHVGIEATPIVSEVDSTLGGLSLDWGFSGPLPPNTSNVPSIQSDIQSYTSPLEKTSTIVVDSLTITDEEKKVLIT